MSLPRVLARVTLVLLTHLIAGCDGLTYVSHLADGQLGIQGHTEPVDDVLASGRLSPDDQAKLELIVQARDYAAQTVGLSVGDNYQTYYDTGNDPQAWNLSAAHRDALIPLTWTFPVVGEVPYLAFFDEPYLRRYERQLTDAGYDTMSYELDAYSTIGVFEDPVRSTMLRRNELSLVETVIHESLHGTIWRQGNTNFNESLATFVGRQGAIEFFQAQTGDLAGWATVAVKYYADQDMVNVFLLDFYNEMADYYAQPLTADEKIAGRDARFTAASARFAAEIQPTLNYPDTFGFYADLPVNNAWLLANYRYNLDLDLMADVHAATGRDWAATLSVFQAAANASGDPFQYLRDWLAQHG